jgi:hypothetical protein
MSVGIAFHIKIGMKMGSDRLRRSRLSISLDRARPYECCWDRDTKG